MVRRGKGSESAPTDKAAPRAVVKSAVVAPLEIDLHPMVLGLMVGAYVYLIVMFWLMFGAQADSAFVMVISTGFFVVYIAVPVALVRIGHGRSDGTRFSDFLRGKTDTNTGALDGFAAMMQVLIVPISLAIGATGFAIIHFVRLAAGL